MDGLWQCYKHYKAKFQISNGNIISIKDVNIKYQILMKMIIYINKLNIALFKIYQNNIHRLLFLKNGNMNH